MKFWNFLAVMIPFMFSINSLAENKIEDIDVVLIRDNLTVGMHAPSGYDLDTASAQNAGLCGFYINKGKTFNDSPTVIYGRIASKEITGDKGIEVLVKDVADSYKKASAGFKLESKDEYKSKGKSPLAFTIRYFLNGPYPNNFEAAGYVKIGKSVVLVIYSAKTEQEFSAGIKAFYETLDRVVPYSTSMPMLSGKCLYPTSNKSKK